MCLPEPVAYKDTLPYSFFIVPAILIENQYSNPRVDMSQITYLASSDCVRNKFKYIKIPSNSTR